MKLIENLRLFNTKERFHLIAWALGNPEFKVHKDFITAVKKAFDLKVLHDDEFHYFAAMDYHIDWIYASLHKTFRGERQFPRKGHEKAMTATQEDIDFIFCFFIDGTYHLIMLEAKGITGWTNQQTLSKARRLEAIFGNNENGDNWENVIPYFAIVSRKDPRVKKSKGLEFKEWPKWMLTDNQPIWIELKYPERLEKITRYSDSKHKSCKDGDLWKIVAIK